MRCIVLVVALLCASAAACQPACADSLHGLVTCEAGCHIDRAVLTLSGPENHTTESSLGLYSFENVTAGDYTLTVERDGYETWSGAVAVNGTTELEIILVEEEGDWWPWALFAGLSVVAVSLLALAGLEMWRRRGA